MNVKMIYLIFLLGIIYIPVINKTLEIPFKSIKINDFRRVENNNNKGRNDFLKKEENITITSSLLFATEVKIGSNNQKFNLLLDTGSNNVWVAKKGSFDKVKISNHFDPTASNSSSNTNIPFQITYGTGYCIGYYFSDYFIYINNSRFKMLFGVAYQTDFSVDGIDGIIGLGHNYYNKAKSFINMLYQSEITNSLSFSLKFGDNIYPGESGKLIIGKHEDFFSKKCVTTPLIHSSEHWVTQINGFWMTNSKSSIKSKKSFDFRFDTGVNNIILPLEYYNDLKDEIGKLKCFFIKLSDQNIYHIACDDIQNLPDFSFEINGNILIVPKENSFYKSKDYFISLIYFWDLKVYTIGTPFFLTFHTLFDKENELLHFYPENDEYIKK